MHWVILDFAPPTLHKSAHRADMRIYPQGGIHSLAQEMLTKIKARIHELDHWRDKEETQSIISVMIRDLLWAELPESYDDIAIAHYRQQIYEYVYQVYPAA